MHTFVVRVHVCATKGRMLSFQKLSAHLLNVDKDVSWCAVQAPGLLPRLATHGGFPKDAEAKSIAHVDVHLLLHASRKCSVSPSDRGMSLAQLTV